jgi:ubiquinone/menaquinone biosynthesis C-methylase UbiE
METTIDLAAIKTKQRTAWASGNYAVIGTTLQLVGEQLAETMDIRCDEKVLDVAAGNGNATLAAARRGARVTSTDYVEGLLEAGAMRADAEGLAVEFEVADVEALPYQDGEFDAVISTFGVMFAPDHAKSASEMLRACRSGGKIGLANWTPASLVGHMFRAIGKQMPPPAGLAAPSLWGTEEHLRSLFGAQAAKIDIVERAFSFRYRSPAHFLEVFRTWYGPVHKAFGALPADKAALLERDLLELFSTRNRAGAGSLVVPSEYLEVVITKR